MPENKPVEITLIKIASKPLDMMANKQGNPYLMVAVKEAAVLQCFQLGGLLRDLVLCL